MNVKLEIFGGHAKLKMLSVAFASKLFTNLSWITNIRTEIERSANRVAIG